MFSNLVCMQTISENQCYVHCAQGYALNLSIQLEIIVYAVNIHLYNKYDTF